MATDAAEGITRAARARLLRGIYVIVNESAGALNCARAVLDAGVRIVQYRAKAGIAPATLRRLRQVTRERNALLIVNDDWRAAIEYECDGVHLGPDDDGFADAAPLRSLMPQRLIGLSCGTDDEVRRANTLDVDYLGVGAVYRTISKADAGAPIGIETLRRLIAQSRVPVAAIGGITSETMAEVRIAGAAMAAVIGAIANHDDAKDAALTLVRSWNAAG